jgi:hypothetical protein
MNKKWTAKTMQLAAAAARKANGGYTLSSERARDMIAVRWKRHREQMTQRETAVDINDQKKLLPEKQQ